MPALPFAMCAQDDVAEPVCDSIKRCCEKRRLRWRLIVMTADEEELTSFLERENVPYALLLEVQAQKEFIRSRLRLLEKLRGLGEEPLLVLAIDQLRVLELMVNQGATPFAVLCMPIAPDGADARMLRAVRELDVRLRARDKSAAFSIGGKLYNIPMHSILCLEARDKHVDICTENQRITVYESLKALQQQLDERFFQTHRSFLVNMQRVRQADFPNLLLLLDGDLEAPIARGSREAVRRRLTEGGIAACDSR